MQPYDPASLALVTPPQRYGVADALTSDFSRPELRLDFGPTGRTAPIPGTPVGGGKSRFWSWDGAFGRDGWAMPAIGTISGLANTWLGFKQLGIAEDSLDFQKGAFSKQFEANKQLTNSRLSDRQRARIASNPEAYQDHDSYMASWGVK
jgi:hypothetical protein